MNNHCKAPLRILFVLFFLAFGCAPSSQDNLEYGFDTGMDEKEIKLIESLYHDKCPKCIPLGSKVLKVEIFYNGKDSYVISSENFRTDSVNKLVLFCKSVSPNVKVLIKSNIKMKPETKETIIEAFKKQKVCLVSFIIPYSFAPGIESIPCPYEEQNENTN